MLKVTYKVAATFSLKNYADGNLLARSYEYPTTSTLRGALLASIIQRKGKQAAADLFFRLKETMLFVQVPETFARQQFLFNAISNKGVAGEKTVTTVKEVDSIRTVAIRELVKTKDIVFYIDETLDNVVEYLENINVLGNSESLVSLHAIERVDKMENILMETAAINYRDETVIYEDWDWLIKRDKKGIDKGLQFKDIYAYSGKNANKTRRKNCKLVKELAC